jgi:hypothetical protein
MTNQSNLEIIKKLEIVVNCDKKGGQSAESGSTASYFFFRSALLNPSSRREA